MVAVIVGPFAYIAAQDAVSIKQHLQEQTTHIERLSAKYEKLDARLNETVDYKNEAALEIQKLETETQNAILERQKLEAELGAN